MNVTVKKGEMVTIRIQANKTAYLVNFSDNDCGNWQQPDDFSGTRSFLAPPNAGHCDGFDVLFTFTRDDTGKYPQDASYSVTITGSQSGAVGQETVKVPSNPPTTDRLYEFDVV